MNGIERRPIITKKQALGIKDPAERRFALGVIHSGLIVTLADPIQCDNAVKGKDGKCVKRKTVPDFTVIDPETNQSMRVEVTKGGGKLESKLAQLRVVEAAGVTNYIQIHGDQIDALGLAPTRIEKRALLYEYFGW